MYGDTGGVNLCEGGVCEVSTLAVALHGSRTVATHSIGREEEGVAITAGTDNYGVGREALDLTSHEVACDDTTCTAIDDNEVEHLVAGVELYVAQLYLTAQCRVSTEEELLTGLAAGIERTGYLSTTE